MNIELKKLALVHEEWVQILMRMRASEKAPRLPAFQEYAFKVNKPGTQETENAKPLGAFLRDVMKVNMKNFHVFGPEHPHGLASRDFDSLFTVDKPIIFNFHGYPWLIHRLAYRRKNHDNMNVRGYKGTRQHQYAAGASDI